MEFESFRARARRTASKLKTCSVCDMPKPLEQFSQRMGVCKPCYSNRLVTCGCGRPKHRRLPETSMKIYVVRTEDFVPTEQMPYDIGKYYKSQGCMDKSNKISRKELNNWKKET